MSAAAVDHEMAAARVEPAQHATDLAQEERDIGTIDDQLQQPREPLQIVDGSVHEGITLARVAQELEAGLHRCVALGDESVCQPRFARCFQPIGRVVDENGLATHVERRLFPLRYLRPKGTYIAKIDTDYVETRMTRN